MNQTEFLKKLKDLVEKKQWKVKINQQGEIRLKKPYGRAYAFDPITAVCFDQKNVEWNFEDDASNAGRQLGLHEQTVQYLCESSDFKYLSLKDEKLEKTRISIAEALNLNIDGEIK